MMLYDTLAQDTDCCPFLTRTVLWQCHDERSETLGSQQSSQPAWGATALQPSLNTPSVWPNSSCLSCTVLSHVFIPLEMLKATHEIRQAKLRDHMCKLLKDNSTHKKERAGWPLPLKGLGSGEHPAGLKSNTHSPIFGKKSQLSLLWDCSQWPDFKITPVFGCKEGLKGPWEGAYSHMDSLHLLVHLLWASPTSTRTDLVAQVGWCILWAISQPQSLEAELRAQLWADVAVPGSDMSPPVPQALGSSVPIAHSVPFPAPAHGSPVGFSHRLISLNPMETPRPQCDWEEKGHFWTSEPVEWPAVYNICISHWDLELECPQPNQGAVDAFTPLYRVVTACGLSKLVNSSDQTGLSANIVNNCWAIAPYKWLLRKGILVLGSCQSLLVLFWDPIGKWIGVLVWPFLLVWLVLLSSWWSSC